MLVPLVKQGYSFFSIRARFANIGRNLEHRETLKAAEVRYLMPAQPGSSPTTSLSLDLQVQPRAIWAGCLVPRLGPIARLNLMIDRRGETYCWSTNWSVTWSEIGDE